MGKTRALLVVEEGGTYINDRELARDHLTATVHRDSADTFAQPFVVKMKAVAAGNGGPVAEMPWDEPVEVHGHSRIGSFGFGCLVPLQQGVG